MNLSIGPFSLSFKIESKSDKSFINMNDIDAINDIYIRHIRKLSKKNLLSRLDSISIDRDYDTEKAKEILKNEGVLIIRNFINKNSILKLENIIEDIKNIINKFRNTNILNFEDQNILIQKFSSKLKNYSELSMNKKTVFNLRSNQDQGMVDIFNINLAYPALGKLFDYEKKVFLNKLISENYQSDLNNLNLYINEDITKTRGFHVDNHFHQFKAFIYLTDCLDLNDGPYTYVKKSHTNEIYKKFNTNASRMLKNNTESPFLITENITPLLSEKGTLIVSNQTGIHRGFPQSKGHSRIVLVKKLN